MTQIDRLKQELEELNVRILRESLVLEERTKAANKLEQECRALGIDTDDLEAEQTRLQEKLARIYEDLGAKVQEAREILDDSGSS